MSGFLIHFANAQTYSVTTRSPCGLNDGGKPHICNEPNPNDGKRDGLCLSCRRCLSGCSLESGRTTFRQHVPCSDKPYDLLAGIGFHTQCLDEPMKIRNYS